MRYPQNSYNKDGTVSLHLGPPTERRAEQIFVWASISVNGPRVMKLIEDKFDSKLYIKLLETNILPHVTALSPFVHDHFPVHMSTAVKAWAAANKFVFFQNWPKKSGDLMPLTDVFEKIVLHVNRQGTKISSQAQLWATVQNAFHCICDDDRYITSVFDKIPETLKTIAINNGNS